jgi:hypothetical protein
MEEGVFIFAFFIPGGISSGDFYFFRYTKEVVTDLEFLVI